MAGVPRERRLTLLRALEGTGLYRLLEEKYPDYPLLTMAGEPSRPLPVWAEPAPRSQWENVEAALGNLDLSRPAPGLREWSWRESFDPRGEPVFRRHVEEWDRQVREVGRGRRRHLQTWNQRTFDLASIERTDAGPKLHCRLGTHFHSLATSKALDLEIVDAYSDRPDGEPDEVWPRLQRRAWLHDRVADPVADAGHRSAALGVSTLTIVRIRRRDPDGYAMFLSPCSVTVAVQHVIPAGIFQPFAADESEGLRAQFSVRAAVLRELVEELHGVEEPETGDGRADHGAIFRRPEARLLQDLLERGDARLLYTGVAVNLLTLRPEVCTVLIVEDPTWYERQRAALQVCGEHLPESRRMELLPEQQWLQPIALGGDRLEPDPAWRALLRPGTLVPPGWAAVDLGLRVAREVL